MATLTAEALSVLQRQAGHITASQLMAAGVSKEMRRRLVHTGVLERPAKSVYRIAANRPTLESRLLTVSLSHQDGFLTGPLTGKYLDVRRMPARAPIHLCLPHGGRTMVPVGVVLRQSTRITALDRRRLDNGVIVASWPRLLFDLAADLSPSALLSAIDQVLQRGECTFEELCASARRLCHPRRRGSLAFARALMQRGDRLPVDSDPELLVLEGLRGRGVPVEPQFSIVRLPNGKPARIDLSVPAVRWGVELDIHPVHDSPLGSASDDRRDRQLHLMDWQVEHVKPVDMLDVEGLLDELAELYFTRVGARAA